MESLLAFNKGFKKSSRLILISLLCLVFNNSCKSTPKSDTTSDATASSGTVSIGSEFGQKPEDSKTDAATADSEKSASAKPVTPAVELPPEKPVDWSKALTKIGKNEKPSFSQDGRRMLFISRDRPAHRNRQLYELNLETKQERRLTYQDGEVYEGISAPDDQSIFYTSTTDEIKDRPILFYPELKSEPFPTTEIYRIKPKDDLHERWTTRPGFDGFIHANQDAGKGLTVTQSRWIGSDLQLYRSYGQKSNFEDMGAKKTGQWAHSFTTTGKKGLKAWVQENAITGATNIVIQKPGAGKTLFDLPTYEIRDLQILETSPDKLEFLYTGKLEKMGSRKAYWLNINDKCQSQFIRTQAEVTSLQLAADGKSLAWTLAQGDDSQIFWAPLDRGNSPCEALPEKSESGPHGSNAANEKLDGANN